MKKTTIEDAAKKAGVSKEPVSAVMNARNTVSLQTRDHVLEVMKELHFRPQGIARNLRNGNQYKNIGIIIKDVNYPFFTAIASGVRNYTSNKGHSLLITSSECSHQAEDRLSQFFSAKDVKGAIIAPLVEGTAEIEHHFKLKRINYPFVLLADVKGIQANVVAIDNSNAIKKAVKYLTDHGHTRIVHFAGPPARRIRSSGSRASGTHSARARRRSGRTWSFPWGRATRRATATRLIISGRGTEVTIPRPSSVSMTGRRSPFWPRSRSSASGSRETSRLSGTTTYPKQASIPSP